MRTFLALTGGSLALLVAGIVEAQTMTGFGQHGQIAVSEDFKVSFSSTSVAGAPESATNITLAPAGDYFVIDGLSLGGQVAFTWDKAGETNTTGFGLGPRVGYNVGITDQLSFWPKAGLMFSHSSTSPGGYSDSRITLQIFVPLLFHPAPHFFLGIGPGVSSDVTAEGGAKTTTVSIASVVGGWF